MNINDAQRLNGVGPVLPKKVEKMKHVHGDKDVSAGGTILSADKVEISKEAKELEKITNTMKSEFLESVNNVPDMREDKIKVVQARLANGDYNRPDVLEGLAKRLLLMMGS